MNKSRLTFVLAAVAVVVGIGLTVGLYVTRFFGPGSGVRVLNTATIIKQIQGLSQLVTVKYVL